MAEHYYCLTHDRVEEGRTCRAEERLGPYPTAEAAERWRERHEGREDRWKDDDERWHGHDDD